LELRFHRENLLEFVLLGEEFSSSFSPCVAWVLPALALTKALNSRGKPSYNAGMRGRLPIAALAAALLASPLWGQMGAAPRTLAPIGRTGFAGPVIAGRSSVAIGAPRTSVRFGVTFGQSFFFSQRFHHHRRFFFATAPWWWYGYVWPYYYGAYSYPLFWDTYASRDSAYASYEQMREMAQKIDRLSDEVERLREELAARSTPPNPPPAPQAEKKPAPHQPTALVFRDKHIQEVKNYAIVGQTLWIFDEQRAVKVPLSSLDADATTKLNEQRGVEFSLPKK